MRNILVLCMRSLSIALVFVAGCTQGLHQASSQPNAPDTAAIGYAEYFSKDGQHPEQIVIDSVDAATREIVTAMYSFTYQPIWDAYARAASRQLPITLVVDRTELHGINNTAMRKGVAALCQLGYDVREDTFSGLMHLKLTAIDQRRGLGGSYNYTTAATRSNDEILTVIDSPKYVAEYRDHILETYSVSANACNDLGTPVPVPSPGVSLEGSEDGN